MQWNVREARRRHDLATARHVDAGEQLQRAEPSSGWPSTGGTVGARVAAVQWPSSEPRPAVCCPACRPERRTHRCPSVRRTSVRLPVRARSETGRARLPTRPARGRNRRYRRPRRCFCTYPVRRDRAATTATGRTARRRTACAHERTGSSAREWRRSGCSRRVAS